MKYANVFAAMFNTPLMVHPGKAAAVAMGLGGRLTGADITVDGASPLAHVAFGNGRASMGVIGDRLGRSFDARARRPYDMVGSVAVIPVEGTLVHKGSFVESESGETSYQGIQTQVSRAMRDEQVRGVVFEIDSYGGQVNGAFQTSDMIHQLSKVKPTLAIFTDNGFSGGYLMASACRSIVLPETGGAGSIGVLALHVDRSAALEAMGLKVTILAAGAHKADANPYETLPETVAARWISELEDARKVFASTVSRYRGDRLSYEAAMATEAQCYIGAEAVKVGLADATGHPNDAFLAFISMINRA
jgi:capsid assembly protease